ncbi:hypothetical protein GCM10010218_36840 [Streptomyces mashuensis]|uniref:Virginiamycin B lyase n=1 Tax=Streptomyces mashuensis TaxID=33904 RepID=A0A919B4Q5_9ACTN|nr:hypothetical protein [Streptomyces mashuensis]GHF52077.1 hypothetical protein GCM10010218_36840 [Streptomyces mashuensis]
MPSAASHITPESDSNTFPIDAAATDLVWRGDDQNLWFVTTKGIIGFFEPRDPWGNTVFGQGSGLSGSATSLVAWPGHGVWTFVTGQDGAAFVKCTDGGQYQAYPLNGITDCQALALGKGRDGRRRLVAPLISWNQLAIVDAGGGVQYSQMYPGGLYGIGIAAEAPTRYWLTSPGTKALVAFDATNGSFGPAVTLGVTPQHVAVSPAGDVVWVSTTEKKIVKYLVADNTHSLVDTPHPAGHMLATADGTLWFAAPAGNVIGYVLPGATRAATIPTGAGSHPSGLAVAGDGRLWIALAGQKALQRVSRHRLAVVSGDGQTTHAGHRFAEPFVVKATQLDGTPVGGQKVEFSVEEGAGVFENGEPTEVKETGTAGDGLGVATSSLLKPLREGPCPVTARWQETDAVAAFTRLVVTPEPEAADRVRYVSGAGQTVPAGKSFEHPMRVVVEDVHGNAVEGARVTFKVRGENMAIFPGGVDTAEVTSGSDGSADSPVLTAGDKPGGFPVEAWADGTSVGLLFHQNIH